MSNAGKPPKFKVLSDDAFGKLSTRDKLQYLKTAIEFPGRAPKPPAKPAKPEPKNGK